MGVQPPIIFIHYGAADYLRRTLAAARRSNPGTRIVLLGDAGNRACARGLAEFHPYEDLGSGKLAREFDSVFRVIQGERHRFSKLGGVEVWLRFVFRRWFLIGEFLDREGIGPFWTFDSDTLILAELAPRAARFAGFEATCQCKGECLNGWIGSREIVSRYNHSTIGLFSDTAFLEKQRERLKIHVGLAFNEMDAFSEFRRREGVATCHAQIPIGGECFDDALAFVEGFEPSKNRILGRTEIKRLRGHPGGPLFAKTEGGETVRLLTCNMSWMPLFLWKTLYRHCLAPDTQGRFPSNLSGRLPEISLTRPWRDILWEKMKGLRSPTRSFLRRRDAGDT